MQHVASLDVAVCTSSLLPHVTVSKDDCIVSVPPEVEGRDKISILDGF